MSEPKRRWLRFSLRTMLVVSLGLSILAGMHATRVRRQQRAVAAILAMGGSVRYEPAAEVTGENVWPPRRLRKLLGDDYFFDVEVVSIWDSRQVHAAKIGELNHLRHLPRLKQVVVYSDLVNDSNVSMFSGREDLDLLYLVSHNLTDDGLAELRGLPELRTLKLNSPRITSSGLQHLSELRNLESLRLGELRLDESSLSHLAPLTQLTQLHVGHTEIGDADLAHLAGLTRLKTLDLRATRVTDAGLVHLVGLAELRFLDLRGTTVTSEGKDRVEAAIPDITSVLIGN